MLASGSNADMIQKIPKINVLCLNNYLFYVRFYCNSLLQSVQGASVKLLNPRDTSIKDHAIAITSY